MQMSCVISDFSLWFMLWPISIYHHPSIGHVSKNIDLTPLTPIYTAGVHVLVLEDSQKIQCSLNNKTNRMSVGYIELIGLKK